MSKSSSKTEVSVGSALSLVAEIIKALSPVLRELSQEQVNQLRKNPLRLQKSFRQLITGRGVPICLQNSDEYGQFFLDNVVDEFGDKHKDINIDLSRFSFQVRATEFDSGFALKIEAYPRVESIEFDKPEMAENPTWTVEFEQLVNTMYEKGSLVAAERVSDFGKDLELKITEEYVARKGVLRFRNYFGNLYVCLQIDRLYLETPLSYSDAQLFEVKREVTAKS